MNRQQFIDYLKTPALLNSESLVQLTGLEKDYPFFQSAYTMLALNLYLEKNIKFNDQLKLASAYASDRKVLKQLLSNLQKLNRPAMKLKRNEQELSVVDDKKTAVYKEYNSEDQSLSDLINQLKAEVNYFMIQSSNQKSTQQFAKLHTLAEKLEEMIATEVKPSATPARKKGTKRISSTEYNLDHLEELPTKKKNQLANAELIDKFIKEEPKIVPKPTFFDPVDMAKHSLLDNESVVSETLAEIYYKQGNLSKAIKIYKKLSLVNPQKSSYFAAQIEKIQKEIK
jgi:hypothetical protein